MDKKNMTLLFYYFETIHIGKDVFIVPEYLAKQYNCNLNIVTACSPSIKDIDSIGDVQITKITELLEVKNNKKFTKRAIIYLFKNARNIDFLVCFHTSRYSRILTCIYKMLNPRGLVYVKADGGQDLLINSSRINNILSCFFLKKVNTLSIENENIYREVIKVYPQFSEKILKIPNGFDSLKLKNTDIKIKTLDEKENLIITVGRLGSYHKNTEFILEALKRVEFNNWKCVLIGPIEKEEQDFQKKIDVFFIQNPHLKDKVIFTGSIENKEILWEYYNKAKVFILSSRQEGYALVLSEAYYFSNYIISTDVGGARDTISDGYGEIVDNESDLTQSLQNIINNQIDLPFLYSNSPRKDISWNTLLEGILD